MKTSVIEVRDMLSVLSVVGVEKRIGAVPGVESVTVDYAGGSATVRYDESRLDLADIKSDVRQAEYENAKPASVSAVDDRKGRSMSGARPPGSDAAPQKPMCDTGTRPPASATPVGDKQKGNSPPASIAPMPPKASPDSPPPAGATPVDDGHRTKAAPER